MTYIYKRQLAHTSNYGGSRTADKIKYLVVHYTGNDGDSDEANALYFQKPLPPGKKASAHYFVDDDSVTQSVGDLYTAWSVGGSKYSDCNQTGGGKFYSVATNANSINIELCDTVKNGKVEPTEKTLQNTIALIQSLMQKYNVPIERVIRHFDVNGKKCPEYFVDEKAWSAFKKRIAPGTAAQKEPVQEKESEKGTYIVTAPDGLNVRAGDGTKHKKLYALSKSDIFKVDYFSGEWAHGKDNRNREGYAYRKWLEKAQE